MVAGEMKAITGVMIARLSLRLGLRITVNILGKYLHHVLALLIVSFAVPAIALAQRPAASAQAPQPEAAQLLALANQARAAAGAQPLQWDASLAVAARKHCLRMADEGPLSHRYPGELDLPERAKQSGARFSLIEENIAIGPTPSDIHEQWMYSQGHRDNLLNPHVNRVGIAVVTSRGVFYATADYSRGVQNLSASEVEARVAALIRPSGLPVSPDHRPARAACSMDRGVPEGSTRPGFIMRWQDSELSKLPVALAQRLASGLYHQAVIGSCAPADADTTFTAYRIAVLLY